jgi:hypothetical protein
MQTLFQNCPGVTNRSDAHVGFEDKMPVQFRWGLKFTHSMATIAYQGLAGLIIEHDASNFDPGWLKQD